MIRAPRLRPGSVVRIVAPSGPVPREAFLAGRGAAARALRRSLRRGGGLRARRLPGRPRRATAGGAAGGAGRARRGRDRHGPRAGTASCACSRSCRRRCSPRGRVRSSGSPTGRRCWPPRRGRAWRRSTARSSPSSRASRPTIGTLSFSLSRCPVRRCCSTASRRSSPGASRGRCWAATWSSSPAWWGRRTCPISRAPSSFFEDIGERPYRIDRLVTHLDLAGVFGAVSAVVLGDFSSCREPAVTRAESPTAEEVLLERLGRLPIPVVRGGAFGHGTRNRRARLRRARRARHARRHAGDARGRGQLSEVNRVERSAACHAELIAGGARDPPRVPNWSLRSGWPRSIGIDWLRSLKGLNLRLLVDGELRCIDRVGSCTSRRCPGFRDEPRVGRQRGYERVLGGLAAERFAGSVGHGVANARSARPATREIQCARPPRARGSSVLSDDRFDARGGASSRRSGLVAGSCAETVERRLTNRYHHLQTELFGRAVPANHVRDRASVRRCRRLSSRGGPR